MIFLSELKFNSPKTWGKINLVTACHIANFNITLYISMKINLQRQNLDSHQFSSEPPLKINYFSSAWLKKKKKKTLKCGLRCVPCIVSSLHLVTRGACSRLQRLQQLDWFTAMCGRLPPSPAVVPWWRRRGSLWLMEEEMEVIPLVQLPPTHSCLYT